MVLNPDQLYGAGFERMFPEGSSPVQAAPWPRAGRRKDAQDYDPARVQEALSSPPQLQQVDPRGLRASQPSVTSPGVRHYMDNPQWHQTGETYADQGNAGNRNPVVYRRYREWSPTEGTPSEDVLLSGHHRGTAALLRGESLSAVVVEGPWGPPRRGSR